MKPGRARRYRDDNRMNDGETMALLKRFDTLEVATADLADAVGIYRGNFGLELKAGSESGSATLKVGGAEIRLVAGAAAAATIAANGEGLAALWLEAEDVGQVVAALKGAGLEPAAPRIDQGRRVLAVDPKIANQVPLFIFDRKV
jgi:predicted enzyme related to lactoylglutathione lyase